MTYHPIQYKLLLTKDISEVLGTYYLRRAQYHAHASLSDDADDAELAQNRTNPGNGIANHFQGP